MTKFIRKIVIFTLPISALLILVNYFGDAARLFDNDFEKVMVSYLVDGQNVTNIENYNERLFQKEIISNQHINPDLVIIGSSRTMLINSGLFTGYNLFNSSVSGASIEDIISIYQIYKDYNKLPKKVIIGIDPWTFNENNGQNRWQSLSKYYYSFLNSDYKDKSATFIYRELLSITYFQNSLKMVPRIISGNSNPIPTIIEFNRLNTKKTDGSIAYGEDYRKASSKEINNRIRKSVSSMYSVDNFDTISPRIWEEFEKLISDMNNYGIEIEFFLAPYAPLVYEKLKEYPMALKTEKIVNDFAVTHNINIYGSFNPSVFGLDESYFYDGIHLKEEGIEKIINN